MRQRIVAVAARPEFWLLGLLCWLLLSAGRSLGTPWARVGLTEALRWSAGIGLALTLGLLLRPIKTAARCVVTLAGTLALLGIAGGFRPGGGGLTGPYQDHQLYGSVLLLLLPPVVAVALTARDSRWRLAGVAAAGAGGLCLALSQTRSAWAGALAAALVFGGLWLFRSRQRQRAGRTLLASAVALTVAVLGLWLLLAPPDLRAPLATRVGTLSRLGADGSWQGRLTTWQGAARLAAVHPPCAGSAWAAIPARSGNGLGPAARWNRRSGLRCPKRPIIFICRRQRRPASSGWDCTARPWPHSYSRAHFACGRTRRQRSPGQDALVIASLSLVAGQAVDAFRQPLLAVRRSILCLLGAAGGRHGRDAAATEAGSGGQSAIPSALHRAGQFTLSGGDGHHSRREHLASRPADARRGLYAPAGMDLRFFGDYRPDLHYRRANSQLHSHRNLCGLTSAGRIQ